MFNIALLAVAALAVPFRDAQNRFSLELPSGWSLAPQPGIDDGAVFKKMLDKTPALAGVRLLNVGDANAAGVARDLSLSEAKEVGFKLIKEEGAELGGLLGIKRRYMSAVEPTGKTLKMVEERVVVNSGVAYVLHVETLVVKFASAEKDFNQMFKTFRVGGSVPASSVSLISSPLVGRWLMVGSQNTIFELRADGTFDLDGTQGGFRVEGNQVYTRPQNGGEENFTWQVSGQELVLRSPNLGEPIRYRKISRGQP